MFWHTSPPLMKLPCGVKPPRLSSLPARWHLKRRRDSGFYWLNGYPGRWRVRRDTASRDDERGGLGVCLPHVQGQYGDVGRRDVLRRRVGGVYQAGAADRAQGSRNDPRGLWAGDAAVLLGEGSCRAVVFGQ